MPGGVKAIDVIRVVAPRARKEYIEAFERGESLLNQYKINTPLRLAHFLAQILHESGGLTITFENMNYKASRMLELFGVGRHSAAVTPAEAKALAGYPEKTAERVYGLGNPRKAKELGNLIAGDAYRCRGGGPMQITGAGAYKRYGEKCGVDFYGYPSLICSSEHVLKPPLYEWAEKGCNALADRNDIGGITRKINGGLNGFEDRRQWFKRVYPLCSGGAETHDAWKGAARDKDIEFAQNAINELGYNPPLDVDGLSGPKTEKAVIWFQKKAKLGDPDGEVGPVTLAALRSALDGKKAEVVPKSMASTNEGRASGGFLTAGALEAVQSYSSSAKEIKSNIEDAGLFDILGHLAKSPAFWIAVGCCAIALFFYFKHREENA